MNTPLEITFKGLDRSEAIEAKILEKTAKLEKVFDRMTALDPARPEAAQLRSFARRP